VDRNGIPSLNTSEVTTDMLVESGQTVFIAGLISNDDSDGREGAPLLGDIPLIGNLFTNKSKSDNNKETIVLISPEIVDPERSPWHRRDIEESHHQIDDVLMKEHALEQRRRRDDRQLDQNIKNDLLFDRAYER
jgi:type II secretory pathway component GspD/PulD (secretin)